MTKRPLLLVGLAIILSNASASVLPPPAGYTVPDVTLSPSHRYGFTVGVTLVLRDPDKFQNTLVDMRSGKAITAVNAWPAFDNMNHGEVCPPWWSADESAVLWYVSSKWCPWAMVLIKLKNGNQAWQLDVLTAFQKEILARTKAANPVKYQRVEKWLGGTYGAYPDGFTVDPEPDQAGVLGDDKAALLKFPLKIHTTLTSNPKQMDDVPNLDSEMDGVVNEDGTITITHFKILPHPASN
jgi:hypothetical protein